MFITPKFPAGCGVVDLKWYHKPVRLCMREGDWSEYPTKGTIKFIGWVWKYRVYVIRNLNYGYIAFLEDQTEENLASHCETCGHRLEKK